MIDKSNYLFIQEKLKALEDKLGDAITASNPREVLAKKEMEKLTRERDILAAELEVISLINVSVQS